MNWIHLPNFKAHVPVTLKSRMVTLNLYIDELTHKKTNNIAWKAKTIRTLWGRKVQLLLPQTILKFEFAKGYYYDNDAGY